MSDEEILKSVLKEELRNKKAETETLGMMDNYYKKPKYDVDLEILRYKKAITELENSKIDPKWEQIKKYLLRKDVERFMREQKIRDEMIKLNFTGQESFINEQGALVTGI